VEARVLKSEKGIYFSGPVAQQSRLKSHRATGMIRSFYLTDELPSYLKE